MNGHDGAESDEKARGDYRRFSDFKYEDLAVDDGCTMIELCLVIVNLRGQIFGVIAFTCQQEIRCVIKLLQLSKSISINLLHCLSWPIHYSRYLWLHVLIRTDIFVMARRCIHVACY